MLAPTYNVTNRHGSRAVAFSRSRQRCRLAKEMDIIGFCGSVALPVLVRHRRDLLVGLPILVH